MVETRKTKVSVSYVTKQYETAPTKIDKAKSVFFKTNFPMFWAVRGVSFEAYEGETIAVVGTNGSGKSTLMKMVAGIVPPTSGTININGETSLIAINAGLRGNISGRQNIRLKGLMMGMTDAEINEKMDDIIAFSELGKFIDQPVKTYSSGMKSKLGFSISVHTNPDILIVDEALSVGDATFNRKSLNKIKDFQKQGKTIFFVSHSLGQVREMADRVLWMHYGELRMFGETKVVMDEYDKFVNEFKGMNAKEQADYRREKRAEQEAFSLDDIYTSELRDARMQGHEPSEAEATAIYKAVHTKQEVAVWSKFDKLVIILVFLAMLFMADKIALNLGMRNVMQNPTHLITNWVPEKLRELNEKHKEAE
ncbi:ABC transporter ATP-binding protein [Weissella confusa]|uniref:ABC transporter ATP-binding protein n=1 Tax=Weissella confusa TaxID=1583 RepID=UPI00396F4665